MALPPGLRLGRKSYGERGGVVAWMQRLGSVRAAIEQGSASLEASTEQGGISRNGLAVADVLLGTAELQQSAFVDLQVLGLRRP